VRARGRSIERDEQAVLDFLGKLVLESRRVQVRLVPRVAEHVGEKTLDDAVTADRRDGKTAAGRCQHNAPVRLVVDQPAFGQPFDGRRDRAGRNAEGAGQVACVRVRAVRGQPIDGLERLTIRFR
jgi:hypothetical protein